MELTKVNSILDTLSNAAPAAKQKTSDNFERLVAKASNKLQSQDKLKSQDKLQSKDDLQNQNASQTADKTEDTAADNTVKESVKTDSMDSNSTQAADADAKELKAAVDELIKEENSKGELSEEALNLLNMLSMLLGTMDTSDNSTGTNAQGIVDSLKQKLNLTETKAAKIFAMLDKLVNTQQFDSLVKGSSENSANDIKKELFALLNNLEKGLSKDVQVNPKDGIISLKEVLPEIKQALASKGNSSEQKEASADKKGEELLKALSADDKSENSDPKISNFMNKFSAVKNESVNAVKEPEVINQKNLAGDIIKTLKYMETSSMKNLTVKINPKELGEVVVNITMEAGVMKASITASNKDAYNLIQGNLQDINSRLNNSDVKIANLSLNVYNEDTTYYSNESGRERNQQGSSKGNGNVSAAAQAEEVQEESYLDSNVNKLA